MSLKYSSTNMAVETSYTATTKIVTRATGYSSEENDET
jgi:hypothetical protein